MRILLGILAFTFSVSACASDPDSIRSTDDDIIGGVDAPSPKLDAVGAIFARQPDSLNGGRCTGTLIAPDLVLTAKHCVLTDPSNPHSPTMLAAGGGFEFLVGYDRNAPRKRVLANDVLLCAPDEGGSSGLGCDVALLRLSEPITDVTPIPVSKTPLGPELIGTRFTAIGYGTIDAASTISGTRKLASLTLRATSGPGLRALFPTFQDFMAVITRAEGQAVAEQLTPFYQWLYDRPLLDGYEAELGGAPGDGQDCHGDSGGPLLKNVDGQLVVYGVVSGGVGGIKEVCQNAGTVYATFGPEAQAMIASAEAPAVD